MQPVGEVLSASIINCLSECWQTSEAGEPAPAAPRFGSFLKIDSTERDLRIFAVVFDVITGPQDNVHKPAALKLSRSQLRVEQPQIFALLKTEVHSAIVGHESRGVYQTGLPPHPPQVHDFVYLASDDEITCVSDDLDFIRLVARVTTVPNDELIAASIKEACAARGGDYDFLVKAGQFLAGTFRDDYDRLSAVLRKIRPA